MKKKYGILIAVLVILIVGAAGIRQIYRSVNGEDTGADISVVDVLNPSEEDGAVSEETDEVEDTEAEEQVSGESVKNKPGQTYRDNGDADNQVDASQVFGDSEDSGSSGSSSGNSGSGNSGSGSGSSSGSSGTTSGNSSGSGDAGDNDVPGGGSGETPDTETDKKPEETPDQKPEASEEGLWTGYY